MFSKPTPTTPEGLKQYDHLPAADAVVMAWNVAGPEPRYHRQMQEQVNDLMPVLARAIARLTEERLKV